MSDDGIVFGKLGEFVDPDGDLAEDNDHVLPHAGRVSPDLADVLSFAEQCAPETPVDDQSAYVADAVEVAGTRRATEVAQSSPAAEASFLTQVTEQELDGSTIRLASRLLEELQSPEPTYALGAGNPETGKTNTMSLLTELALLDHDEVVVLSNVRSWELTDVVVTSAHDLAVELLRHRGVPVVIFIDEASTHFDARTFQRAVAHQWSPLAKRFAKLGVVLCGLVGHTGKDVHPEAKAMVNLAFLKPEQTVAGFYSDWPRDSDVPVDPIFAGDVHQLEPTAVEYDPDDAAPWSWNLRPELFTEDLDWAGLLSALEKRGPQ
ncbi:hypothetical protein [Salinarchaeum sp. Harcht-Bsk1]|uniref:hypothetical protein n=1 Tax=Salinarchaeum sp. Harcht-Bsk1 TaxID=1333523 RepID=UPI000A63B232|nr:hypothetical protein [Salinarchaeum sp. Harcht-Bsk1]